MTPPQLLERCGIALHGPNWRHGLAGDLGVRVSSVRHWVIGNNPIPDDIWLRIVAVFGRRSSAFEECQDAIKRLRTSGASSDDDRAEE